MDEFVYHRLNLKHLELISIAIHISMNAALCITLLYT